MVNFQHKSPRSPQAKRPLRVGVKALVLFQITIATCVAWHWRLIEGQRDEPFAWFDRNGLARDPAAHSSLPVYTKDLAAIAIRRTPWICGDKSPLTNEDQRPFFAFVHIYKTAGTTLRQFFAAYAHLCKKSLMIIVNCSGVKHSLLKSEGEDWNSCRLKSVLDNRRSVQEHDYMEDRIYPTVNNTILRENFDVLAGHFRFGLTDHVFLQEPTVRHVVFFRDPTTRFVSSILYRAKKFAKNKKETVTETAKYIKQRVLSNREKNDYLDSIFNYLLTPAQAQTLPRTDRTMEYKTRLAIENLVHYNAIVGVTERFPESMTILQQVLLPDGFTSEERNERTNEMFGEYTATSEEKRENASQMGEVSTSSVMEELRKDEAFFSEFREYLKYEQRIVDYALKMHQMQYELAVAADAVRTMAITD